MATQAPLERYVGGDDDWTFGPITLSKSGVPMDLTGASVVAKFYKATSSDLLNFVAKTLTIGSGVTMADDLTTGTITQIKVTKDVLADVWPQQRGDVTFPTRVKVIITDSAANSRTYVLILILPLDPRTDVPVTS